MPLDCLGSISSSCDELASLISPGPPDATTTCTTMGATCACTMGYAGPMTASASGTYTTAGNVVTLTDETGNLTDASYCVQGNTLHLVDVDATTGAITGDAVATR